MIKRVRKVDEQTALGKEINRIQNPHVISVLPLSVIEPTAGGPAFFSYDFNLASKGRFFDTEKLFAYRAMPRSLLIH